MLEASRQVDWKSHDWIRIELLIQGYKKYEGLFCPTPMLTCNLVPGPRACQPCNTGFAEDSNDVETVQVQAWACWEYQGRQSGPIVDGSGPAPMATHQRDEPQVLVQHPFVLQVCMMAFLLAEVHDRPQDWRNPAACTSHREHRTAKSLYVWMGGSVQFPQLATIF